MPTPWRGSQALRPVPAPRACRNPEHGADGRIEDERAMRPRNGIRFVPGHASWGK